VTGRASFSSLALGAGLGLFIAFGGASANDSGSPSVLAQLFPPASVPEPAQGPNEEAPNLAIRIGRLEDALRQANGAIEQLQNENQRLEAELKRFREDVEFRLSGARPSQTVAPSIATPQPTPAELKPHRSDAFDPNASPNASGSPQQLGTTAPSAPLNNGLEFKPDVRPVGAPLQLGTRTETPVATPPTGPLQASNSGPTVVGSGLDFADGPRKQFDAALETFKAGQYDAAEAQLKAFVAANAGHRLLPDAVFYIGETYLQRSRPREAAEQYLKLSTDYAKSPRAPEGMMRLGQSLALLGNAEQACATFTELGKRYPTAATNVKKAVEREMHKNHC